MVGARVFKLSPPSYVKCFRKTHKTLSEGEREREWRTSPPYSFLLLVLCATLAAAATFNFQATSQKGNRQRKGNQSRRQATWKLAQGRVAHTHTYAHSHASISSSSHHIALVLVEAFFDSSRKILTRTWYAPRNQYLHTHKHTQRTFCRKNMCGK